MPQDHSGMGASSLAAKELAAEQLPDSIPALFHTLPGLVHLAYVILYHVATWLGMGMISEPSSALGWQGGCGGSDDVSCVPAPR